MTVNTFNAHENREREWVQQIWKYTVDTTKNPHKVLYIEKWADGKEKEKSVDLPEGVEMIQKDGKPYLVKDSVEYRLIDTTAKEINDAMDESPLHDQCKVDDVYQVTKKVEGINLKNILPNGEVETSYTSLEPWDAVVVCPSGEIIVKKPKGDESLISKLMQKSPEEEDLERYGKGPDFSKEQQEEYKKIETLLQDEVLEACGLALTTDEWRKVMHFKEDENVAVFQPSWWVGWVVQMGKWPYCLVQSWDSRYLVQAGVVEATMFLSESSEVVGDTAEKVWGVIEGDVSPSTTQAVAKEGDRSAADLAEGLAGD